MLIEEVGEPTANEIARAEAIARRAAQLRFRAKGGSAVDAVVVATAEPGGSVLTGDREDLRALASYAERVVVETI